MQEDPGQQEHVANMWRYSPRADKLTEIAHFDPDRFAPGTPNFLTQDEESSGIIDAALVLGPGWYLFDVECKEWTDGQIGNNDSSYDVRDVDLAPATC
jgi:hypothetical protein